MITTIIFDLAEVYLKGFAGVEKHLEKVLNMQAKEIQEKLQGPEFKPLMEGKITEEEFWRRILERTKWKVDIRQFKQIIRNHFAEIEGTRAIIEQLKSKGYKLGLLSDHAKEWIDHCDKKFDYHKLFHSTQYSFEVETCKSDKKAFKLILAKLHEKAGHCLFIDDMEKNLIIAKSVGINTIQFQNPEQLKKELQAFSIELYNRTLRGKHF